MKVKERMTVKPITIGIDTTISQAMAILDEHNLHRLPVVNQQGKLIGLITGKDLKEYGPSKATSLSRHELNYLLTEVTVETIMVKNVFTISPEALVEEAAAKMLQEDVSCLPVVDENDKVIGIITQTDSFEAFVDLLGYHRKGAHITLAVSKDRVGIIAEIAEKFAQAEINVFNFGTYRTADKITLVIRVNSTSEKKLRELLKDVRDTAIEQIIITK